MENKKYSEEKKENKTTPETDAKTKTVLISEEEYQELKQKSSEYWERLIRLQADFDNARKRWERDKQETMRFAQEEVLAKLLGIVDDFERSLKASPNKPEDTPVFVKGVEMIFSHLQELLKKNGVTAMDVKGKIFNPNYHEPLMIIEKDDVPENTILEEYQRGYFINNKVLRIAKVQLSKKKQQQEHEKEQIKEQE